MSNVYDVIVGEHTHRLELQKREGSWLAKIDDHEMEVDAVLTARDVISILIGGKAYEVKRETSLAGETHMIVGSARYAVQVSDPRSLQTRRSAAAGKSGPQNLTAPMPGKIVRLLVAEGQEVEAGTGLVVIEAMKMQNELKSPKKGLVQKIVVAEGGNVNAGDVLVIVS
jgi:biotin carboxyl carrier protein